MLHNVGAVRPGGCPAASKLLVRSLLASSAAVALLIGSFANAQVAASAPVREAVDVNGVDLFLGALNIDGPTLSAGQSGAQGLAFAKIKRGNTAWGENLIASLAVSGSTVYVYYAGRADRFTISGSSFIPTEGKGSSLALSGNVYTYTLADGTVIHLTKSYVGASPYGSVTGIVTDISRPGGEIITYTYSSIGYCAASRPGGSGQICTQRKTAYRIATIANNSKYRLNFVYGNWDDSIWPEGVPDNAAWQSWGVATAVSLTNTAVTSVGTRTQSFGWSGTNYSVTDEAGRVTSYRITSDGVVGITRAGSTAEDVTIAYSGGRVAAITTAAGTTGYASSDSAGVRTVTVSPPNAGVTSYAFDIASQRMTSMRDPLNRTTSWQYDGYGRLTRISYPEGNYTQLSYDGRGNVTERRNVAKAGSGLADIVATSDYDAACASPAKCNRPNWTRDPKGNQTDYTYSSATGDLLSVASPAATSGAIRPTTSYVYTAINGVQRISGISTCQTSASCVGTADELKTSISYDVNGLPSSISRGAGNGTLIATTAIAYDDVGNAVAVDGPLSGTGDTFRYRYDAARQLVGLVGPDPDGAGPLKPQAERTTYDPKGRVTLIETGNVNSQGDGDWAGFSTLQQVATVYDGVDRKVKETLSAGGSAYQVVQYAYDAAGAYDCTAIRMNSATWGALPDACTLASIGPAGPDRITRTTYDSAGQLTKVQVGYGTADQADEVTGAYTLNGKIESMVDGEGNKTSFNYDGFDRLARTRYPVPVAGAATSSSSDFEELVYDAASNVTSVRPRGYSADTSKHIDYSYDNLGNMTLKHVADASVADVYYGYDLLRRQTYARFSGASGEGITNIYDALGRLISTTNNMSGSPRTLGYDYDLAGNRLRLTQPDGVYFDYGRDLLGRLVQASWSAGGGVVPFLAITYDQAGRRSDINRGLSLTSSGYDPVSRLSSLNQRFAGNVGNFSQTFAYNPAGQISSQTRDDDAYAYRGHYNVDRAYSVNGLNQYTAAGSASFSYDARGNLTSDGSNSFSFDAENRLKTKNNGSVTLGYDPYGRLHSVTSGSAITQFLYDGDSLAAEYNGAGTMTRRYMFAGQDEPILDDAGGMNCSTTRFLHGDERGSVIAQANCSGNRTAVNAYDEFGIPASSNSGRFQYTGQAWLPELGMYYYKARIYSPTLGRFLQTDPDGYRDGINWYDYVGGDPLNRSDPTGRKASKTTYTGSLIPGVIPAGLRINGVSADALSMSLQGFSWNADGSDPASGGEVLSWLLAHHGYTQVDQDGSRQWIDFNFPATSRQVLAGAFAALTSLRDPPVLPHPRMPNPRNPIQQPNGCTGVPDLFPRSCGSHDVCYGTVGVSQSQCDKEFLENMNVEGGTGMRLAARTYYLGVRKMGAKYYSDAQRQSSQYPQ